MGLYFIDEIPVSIELQQLSGAPIGNQEMTTLIDNDATNPLDFSWSLALLAELFNKLPGGAELVNKEIRSRVLFHDIDIALGIGFGEIRLFEA